MSVFYCEGCDAPVDADFEGHNVIDDKEYCDKCYEKERGMKFKIYNEEEKIEKPIEARLEVDLNGELILEMYNPRNGNWYSVIRISNDGALYRYYSVTTELGLKLDSNRRIKIA